MLAVGIMKSFGAIQVGFFDWKWILLIFMAVAKVQTLKTVSVSIPKAVKIYDEVRLQCDYDLGGEPLYSVKWYKGMKEFFRYIPNEQPAMMVFPVLGINVDLSKSNMHEITLQNVVPEASGRYACEVSTDAPNFYTIMGSSYMYVVVVPSERPILHIDKEIEHSSYLLRANCTAPPSFPAMNITWFINGLKVNEVGHKIVNVVPTIQFPKKQRTLLMAVSYISTEVNTNAFQGGAITVKCVSSLFDLYISEDMRYIEDDRPKPWPSSVIGATSGAKGFCLLFQNLPLLLLLGLITFR